MVTGVELYTPMHIHGKLKGGSIMLLWAQKDPATGMIQSVHREIQVSPKRAIQAMEALTEGRGIV